MACAAVAKTNAAFASQHRSLMMNVIRDFANPLQNDPWYPFARMMDWWGGHSWAGGFEVRDPCRSVPL
jgi:endoglucanase Acf2